MFRILLLLLGLSTALSAQETIRGVVLDASSKGLPGVNIYWKGTQDGTVSDEIGKFSLPRLQGKDSLVFSFVGFQRKTLLATANMTVQLKQSQELEEVEVVQRTKSTQIDFLETRKVEQIGEKELLKAACCNLSESFETNPSIDVSFTDAVTGTRQIQLLGLAGPYTQFTRENIPNIRGLNAVSGLEYVPGTWMESIQLNKGAGSVVNGFESMVGQINYELRKPLDSDRLYLNFYANEGGRFEANVHGTTTVSDKLATAVLLHGKSNKMLQDRNGDGFYDMPLSDHFIALNRWFLLGKNGWRYQWGAKWIGTELLGGEIESKAQENTRLWKYTNSLNRSEFFAKGGKSFDLPWKSMGFQGQYVFHDQKSQLGFRNYRAKSQSLYFNGIYQSIIGNTNYKFSTGASFQWDEMQEALDATGDFSRNEWVPGAFFELSSELSNKLSVVSGLRGDYHNNYGFFVTPRLHARYQVASRTVLRASAGRGLRTANAIADNLSQLASTRSFSIVGASNRNPYGLEPEIAWNYGFNLTQNLRVLGKEMQLALDFYRTDFENQIIVDRYSEAEAVRLYNLAGTSIANSIQSQLDYEILQRWDLRLAYRWYDVKSTFNGELKRQPFLSEHRYFINTAYHTISQWFFDATLNWQSGQIIPQQHVAQVPSGPQKSPDFFTINAQVRKVWKGGFEVYAGVENLLNYRQEQPIVDLGAGENRFIDAASVWGPVFGRNVYVGLRYRLE
ncbi:MAG: TonB-dependent receptor [Luteibaculum sp.]